MPHAPSRRRQNYLLFRCALCLAALLLSRAAAAQSNTDGTTPAAVTPGAPAGSYALSGFDNVNLFNGNLNFSLPLLSVRGRGAARHTLTLPVEQRWRVEYAPDGSTNSGYYYPSHNMWYDVRPGYGPGVLLARTAVQGDQECWSTFEHVPQYELTRLTFVGPDGTEHELLDRQTGGKPLPITDPCLVTVASRGQVWTTPDGQSLTFIADAVSGSGGYDLRSGYLLFRDGTRYRVDNEVVTWLRDRNGNKITFAYDQFRRVTAITDSLNRTVTVEYDVADAAPFGTCDRIRFKGFGGQERIIRVSKRALGTRLRPGAGYAIKTTGQLFNDSFGADPYASQSFNPSVTSAVWLPDGRSYQFYYNEYAELARVMLPTGGAFEYDYAAGVSDGPAGGLWWPDIYRRVVERRVYAGGGTGAAYDYKMTYSRPETQAGTQGFVLVEHQKAGGVVLSKDKHYFYGSVAHSPYRPGGPLFDSPGITYGTWDGGKEYKTEALDAAGAVMRRVENTWQQRAPVSWWASWLQEGYQNSISPPEPANDPRLVTAVTTLEPYEGGANLVAKQTAVNPQTGAVGFDQYNNQTDSWDYDYGAGAAGAFVRRTHIDYVTAPSYVNADADPSLGAHLRSLPSQSWVSSDAAGNTKLSRTAYEYDNYSAEATDARHDPLVARANITGHDTAVYSAGFTRRGNLTGETSYADVAAQTGAVTTSTMYDVAGNPVKTVDPRGHASTVGYADSFSNPASGAGAYTPHTYAFRTSATSPVPDASNTYGSNTALTTLTKYDFWTGLVSSATGANGGTTTYSYADPLDRPTAVVRPDGSRTDYSYGDTVGNLYVRTQSDLAAARRTDSYQYFDRLGRPSRSISYENQDAAKPWVTQDIEYDALGRVRRASPPYRAAAGAAMFSTTKWAETAYDALGRVTTVTTRPDNAVVTTSYSGNRVTVTDQALKVRRTVTDALGRLARADEPNAAGALDVSGNPAQPTHYTYDALGNLRKVTQGAQLRFFMYDSLGQLTRAKNPEQAANANLTGTDPVTGNAQWSSSYSYDAAGNLLTRIDARGVTATYTYDPLNRNRTVNYSDSTPDVTRYYDLAALGKGRPWKSEAAGVARTTVSVYDEEGRPESYSQQFWAGTAWGASFPVTRVYDKVGNVTSQTYPSGRSVSYSYDRLGRPSTFSGNLGDSVQRAYADTTLYDEVGGRGQERFGTQTPLYSKRFYNERGQLSEVRVGTKSITSDEPSHWNRGAILNVYSGTAQWTESGSDNNGNLRKQMLFVPNGENPTGGDGWWETAFFYDYDSLNRLDFVREVQNGQNLWLQDYDYDRWGNRTINAATTKVFGTNPTYSIPEPQFTVNTANNRLSPPSGYTMGYDLAGNLTNDTYTGQGARSYDAEGRMTSAQFLSGQMQTATYAYDADSRRVKRAAGAAAGVWQVYGIGGELLAEYAVNASTSSPRKEYGYRGGELLVAIDAPQGGGGQAHDAVSGFSATQNPSGAWAYGYRPASGGSFTAYSAAPSLYGAGAKTWAASVTSCCPMVTKNVSGSDYTYAGAPSIVQPPDLLNLHPGPNGERSVVRWTAPAAGTYTVSGRFQGLDTVGTTSDVLVRHNSATLFSGAVTGYGARVPFSAIVTVAAGDTIEFSVGRGANATYSNDSTGLAASVVPAEAVGAPRWLVADHLGTPRMVADQTGGLAGVTRHDYFPFGEEIGAGIGGRTANQGYVGSNLRQRWAQLERDGETGLDYAQARYYSLPMGRFTSVDPENAGANESEPQSWNGYSYVQNNPLAFVDPQGLERCASQSEDGRCAEWVGDYDGERSKELSMFKDGTYWNAKKQVWESGAAFRDRMSENPIWAISLHMKRMEQPTTRLAVGAAVAPFIALGGAKAAAVAGAEITIGRGLTTLGNLGRAGAPAGAAVLNQLGRGDRAIFQRAAQLGASAKNNFLANLEAVTRAVVEKHPGGGVTQIGNIGNSPVFGSTATRVGIAEVNGQTVIVRMVQGQPKILGPLP